MATLLTKPNRKITIFPYTFDKIIPMKPILYGLKRLMMVCFLIILLPGLKAQLASDSCKIKLEKKTEKTYQEGIDYLKRGNYNLAGQQMRKVISEESGCVDAYFVLGLVNFKKADNNFREAEKNLRKVIELCPSYDVYAYYYLGEIYYGEENYALALKNLDEFLKDVDKIKKDEDYNRAVSLQKYSKFYLEMTGHPVPFTPQVVEGISTPQNEYLPILSPDNQMALFTREIKIEPGKNSLFRETKMKERFLYSMRNPDGKFEEGEEMPEPFNVNDNEGGATLTADNNTLYYTVCKFDNVKKYLNC
ncbi:MAG: tetratricopeptide repeat protein, partial [Bacteroidales bacterium]